MSIDNNLVTLHILLAQGHLDKAANCAAELTATSLRKQMDNLERLLEANAVRNFPVQQTTFKKAV